MRKQDRATPDVVEDRTEVYGNMSQERNLFRLAEGDKIVLRIAVKAQPIAPTLRAWKVLICAAS